MAKSPNSKGKRPAPLHGLLSRPAGVVKRSKISPRSNNKYTSAIAKAERELTAADEYLLTGFKKLTDLKTRELQAYLANSYEPSDAALETWKRHIKDIARVRPLIMDAIKRRKVYSSSLAPLKAYDLKFAKHLQQSGEEIRAAKHRLAYCEDAVNRHTEIMGMCAAPISPSTFKMESEYIHQHAEEAASLFGVIEVLEERLSRFVASAKQDGQEEEAAEEEANDQRPTAQVLALAEIDRLFEFWENLCEHGEQAAYHSAQRAKYANVKHLLTDFEDETRRSKRDLTYMLQLRDQVKEEIQTNIGVLYGKGYMGSENPKQIVEIHKALSERPSRLTPAPPAPKLADISSVDPKLIAGTNLKVGAGADPKASVAGDPGILAGADPKISASVEEPLVSVRQATAQDATVPEWVTPALEVVQHFLDHRSAGVVEWFSDRLDVEVKKLEDLRRRLATQNENWRQQEYSLIDQIEAQEDLAEDLTGSRMAQPGSQVFQMREIKEKLQKSHETNCEYLKSQIDTSSKTHRKFDIVRRYYKLRRLNNKIVRDLLLSEPEKWTAEASINVKSIYTDLDRFHRLEFEWGPIFINYHDVEHPAHSELIADLDRYVQDWENHEAGENSLAALATLSLLQVQEFEEVAAAAKEIDNQYREYRAE